MKGYFNKNKTIEKNDNLYAKIIKVKFLSFLVVSSGLPWFPVLRTLIFILAVPIFVYLVKKVRSCEEGDFDFVRARQSTFVGVQAIAPPFDLFQNVILVILGLRSYHKHSPLLSIKNIVNIHLGSARLFGRASPDLKFNSFAVLLHDKVEYIGLDHIPNFIKLLRVNYFFILPSLKPTPIFQIVDSSLKHPADLMHNHVDKLL